MGPEVAFLDFIEQNPQAVHFMPSGQLGWPVLLAQLRERARDRMIVGFRRRLRLWGDFRQLFAEASSIPRHRYSWGALRYQAPAWSAAVGARFVRWDISEPLPVSQQFDCVICRNALMHTPDPPKTLRSLVARLACGGAIALSVYARKPLLREIVDDALCARIVPLPASEALDLARQLTALGRDLHASTGKIVVSNDVPFLGIKRGEYGVHEFLYNNIIKCWYNPAFGERYSDIVTSTGTTPQMPSDIRAKKSSNCSLISDYG